MAGKTGYKITVTAFVEADPRDPKTMAAAAAALDLLQRTLEQGGMHDIVTKPKLVTGYEVKVPSMSLADVERVMRANQAAARLPATPIANGCDHAWTHLDGTGIDTCFDCKAERPHVPPVRAPKVDECRQAPPGDPERRHAWVDDRCQACGERL